MEDIFRVYDQMTLEEALEIIQSAHRLKLKTVMDTVEEVGNLPPGHRGFSYRVKIGE